MGQQQVSQQPQPPLWWFGHSLSYTTFEFEWTGDDVSSGGVSLPLAALSHHGPTSGLKLTLAVTNTGSVAASKVVQAYYSASSAAFTASSFSSVASLNDDGSGSSNTGPRKTLFAMTKLHLRP